MTTVRILVVRVLPTDVIGDAHRLAVVDGSTKAKWYYKPTYTGFAIACATAWAVIWILLAVLASSLTVHRMAYVFLGWAIGFTTATIGKAIYRHRDPS